MRTALIVSALAALAFAAPRPQDLDYDEIDSAPTPSVDGPPITAVEQPVTYDPTAAASSASAAISTDPVTYNPTDVTTSAAAATSTAPVKRTLGVNDDCGPQPDGYGPTVTPDNPAAFSTSQSLQNIAINAPTPPGYDQAFVNLQGSVNAHSYLGLHTLQSYDTVKCQQLCDSANLCTAFNIYLERDPSVKPAPGCDNPASITNIKCTLYGSKVTAASAVNKGQWRDQFQVVITGSNGYTKQQAPPAFPGFDGPTELGGAINAPLDKGVNTYMGVKYYPGPYNPQQCAAACLAQTAYNKRHATNGSYRPCNFFNSYVLSIADVPQGTYCSLYTEAWDKSYSTNYGQYRGSVYYGVSSSYSYTLAPKDPGTV